MHFDVCQSIAFPNWTIRCNKFFSSLFIQSSLSIWHEKLLVCRMVDCCYYCWCCCCYFVSLWLVCVCGRGLCKGQRFAVLFCGRFYRRVSHVMKCLDQFDVRFVCSTHTHVLYIYFSFTSALQFSRMFSVMFATESVFVCACNIWVHIILFSHSLISSPHRRACYYIPLSRHRIQ